MPSTPTLLVLDEACLADLLTMPELVETQRAAFIALADGSGQLGSRVLLSEPVSGTVVFSYAARLSPSTEPVCKFGAVVPANPARGLPGVSAAVLALHPDTGQPAAILNGETVTRLRTVAASVLAASVLCPAASGTAAGGMRLGVLGAGVQATAHLRALIDMFAPSMVRVWARNPARAGALAAGTGSGGRGIEAVADAREAVNGADLVVTCTSSSTPVLQAHWLTPGTTVISIGSFAPQRCEVGPDIVAGSRVVVDHRETAVAQAGPVVAAVESGSLVLADVIELGDVLLHGRAVRVDPDDVVYYNSVGVGIQDAAVVHALLRRADEGGRGSRLQL